MLKHPALWAVIFLIVGYFIGTKYPNIISSARSAVGA